MERIYTTQTRLEMTDALQEYLNNYIKDFSRLERIMYRDIIDGTVKSFPIESNYVSYIWREYNLTKRTVNSALYDMRGKIKALLELKKFELKQLRQKLSALETRLDKDKRESVKLKSLVAVNKATKEQLTKHRHLKTSIYHRMNKIDQIKHKIANLEKVISSGKVNMCFGSRKLFGKQNHLEENGYKTHKKWLNNFIKARDNEIFYLGSGSESFGNQMLQLKPEADGSFIMSLRKEKNYCKSNSPLEKYITVKDIRFKYLEDWLRICLLSNVPVTYRIKRKGSKWYLLASFHMDVPERTTSSYGVVGLDFNNGFIEAAETDKYGNLCNIMHLDLKYHGTGNKAKSEMEETVSRIVKACAVCGKDLVIENLDFVKKKSATISRKGKKYNAMIHRFDYSRYKKLCKNLGIKYGVKVHMINPAYTSKIGKQKYCNNKKLSIHQAAAYVIARKEQGFKDKLAA